MKHLLKKWILAVVTIVIISLAATYLFFRYEVDQMLGGNTIVVDFQQFKPQQGAFAITHVNVLSSDSQSMRANQTVLINGEYIEAIGETLTIPETYTVIDATGQYLIPGLIDSHVHLKKSKNDLLLYMANGVTHVGEMTGMAHHFDYQADIEQGMIGPTLFIASPKLTNQTSVNATIRALFEKRHQNFSTPEAARQAIRNFKSQGYQAIKLSSYLDSGTYFAINDEARKIGIPVIGHLPVGLQLSDLYQSGQAQLAHIDSITQHLINEFGGLYSNNSEEFLTHLASLADEIAKNFKSNEIALASTVWLHDTMPAQAYDLENFFKGIELQYQNPGWLEGSFVSKGCLPGENSYQSKNQTDQDIKRETELYLATYNQAIKIITQALVRHQVTITAGTDALGACGMIAGFSLHEELKTLKQLGLTNAQVLGSATSVPAQWMGLKSGVIMRGYRADLVLLTKNPLQDVSHTRSIQAVFARGKYLDRELLDKMLVAVKDANHHSRKVNIDYLLN